MTITATGKLIAPISERQLALLLYTILSAAVLYPLFIVEIPPLVDYPSHIARIHILSSIASDTALQANYAVTWRALPNLAMDIILPPLTALMSVYTAGKIFVGLAILIPVAGVAALRKVLHGQVGIAPALAFLPAYNLCLTWGFLNFLFATGLCILAFAGWVASRHWRPVPRAASFALIALGLYFSHIFAFGAYALSVGGYTLHQLINQRSDFPKAWASTLSVAGTQFLLPAAFILLTLLSGSGGYTFYGDTHAKVLALVTPFYSVGSKADFLFAFFVAGFLIWMAIRRRISVIPAMRMPLIFLLLAAIATPEWLMRTWAVDIRLPVVITLAAIASMNIKIESRSTAIALSTIVLALFVARVAATAEFWSRADANLSEFRAATAMIPEGARIMTVQPPTSETPEGADQLRQIYWGLPAIAVIERSAFTPTLFTDFEKQLLQPAERNRAIDTPFGRPPSLNDLESGAALNLRGAKARLHWTGRSIFWTDWPHRLDYVVSVFDAAPPDGVGILLNPIHTGSFFVIYETIKGSCELPDPMDDESLRATCFRDDDAERQGGAAS